MKRKDKIIENLEKQVELLEAKNEELECGFESQIRYTKALEQRSARLELETNLRNTSLRIINETLSPYDFKSKDI